MMVVVVGGGGGVIIVIKCTYNFYDEFKTTDTVMVIWQLSRFIGGGRPHVPLTHEQVFVMLTVHESL
jgi:hypothetical protein